MTMLANCPPRPHAILDGVFGAILAWITVKVVNRCANRIRAQRRQVHLVLVLDHCLERGPVVDKYIVPASMSFTQQQPFV